MADAAAAEAKARDRARSERRDEENILEDGGKLCLLAFLQANQRYFISQSGAQISAQKIGNRTCLSERDLLLKISNRMTPRKVIVE